MRISDWSSDVCSSDLGEVAGEHGVRLGLEPLEAGLGGVGGDAAETLHPADETTDRAGDLDILIVHIEARDAERQPAVEQRSLVADLVAVYLFGVDGEEIVDILIRSDELESELQSLMRD